MAVYRNVQVNFWQDDVEQVCEETEEEEVIEEETGSGVFSFYEQHFGSLSPHTVEELSAW
ncbi:TPA: DNA replication protein DnaD, partial [Bacillus cereus]|nr:DNA replication protein DnaD [Bacillus cereus]